MTTTDSLAQSLVDAAAEAIRRSDAAVQDPGTFFSADLYTVNGRAAVVAVLEALVLAVPPERAVKVRVAYLAELAAEIRESPCP